jgi:hypothetical protein
MWNEERRGRREERIDGRIALATFVECGLKGLELGIVFQGQWRYILSVNRF